MSEVYVTAEFTDDDGTCLGCAREGSHLVIEREDGQAEWLECVCCGAVRGIDR